MLALAWALLLVAGCATTRYDLEVLKNSEAQAQSTALPAGIVRDPQAGPDSGDRKSQAIVLASAENETQSPATAPAGKRVRELKAPSIESRLKVPQGIPGAEKPEMQLPDSNTQQEAYHAAIMKLFPSLSDPPPFDPGPTQAPRQRFALDELQQMALENSPIIAQYESDITGAIGSAIQAGTHPNPIIGYESDTVGSSSTRDYQGIYVSQLIKTAGKLQLNQAIENVDLMNAQLLYRQARNDLLTQIRRQYFSLLVARESIKINEAIVRFTHESYRIQVDQVAGGGLAAPFEPEFLRVLAVQARGNLVAARNNYIVAWKQLTATLNLPDLPLGDLADNPTISVPQIDYDNAVSHVLSMNTEARTARNGPMRARLALRLAEVMPVPDVFVFGTFQRDFTTPGLPRTSYNTQVGIPLPIFDRNKGNILTARGTLVRATQEVTRVQNDLRSRLADAYGRFDTNRILVGLSRDQILPDSVGAYRGTYLRHNQSPEDVGFADVIVAQQNLLNAVNAYIGYLYGQWNAFVDVANLLQIDDLRELQLPLKDRGGEPEPIETPTEGDDVTGAMIKLWTVGKAKQPAAGEKVPPPQKSSAHDEQNVPLKGAAPKNPESIPEINAGAL